MLLGLRSILKMKKPQILCKNTPGSPNKYEIWMHFTKSEHNTIRFDNEKGF